MERAHLVILLWGPMPQRQIGPDSRLYDIHLLFMPADASGGKFIVGSMNTFVLSVLQETYYDREGSLLQQKLNVIYINLKIVAWDVSLLQSDSTFDCTLITFAGF